MERNLAICTSLAPAIGYDKAAAISKEAFKTDRTVREVAIEWNVLPSDELDRLLDGRAMTESLAEEFRMLKLFASCPPRAAQASQQTRPSHTPHQGKVKFTNPKPTKLSKAEIATIKKGDAVRRQIQNDSGGRGIAIMDVKASPDKIWKTIADYKAYPNWIDKLDKTSVYGGSPATGQKVKFELSVFGMDVVYFIDHSFHQSEGYMTWT